MGVRIQQSAKPHGTDDRHGRVDPSGSGSRHRRIDERVDPSDGVGTWIRGTERVPGGRGEGRSDDAEGGNCGQI